MISTITLNAAVDKSYRGTHLQWGRINRVEEVIEVPGGKGINVAKVARTMGAEVTASGILGGSNGEFIHRSLEQLGLISDFVWMSGNSRQTVTVFDNRTGTITEFLEPGPVISPETRLKLETKIQELSGKSRVVVFSGSIASGLPVDIYAVLIRIAKRMGAITILDTSGEALSRGLEGTPDLCKPNIEEFALWLGYRPKNLGEVVEAARLLIGKGIKLVVVSMDKEGSVAVTARSAWHIIPPEIKAENTVGCGDSMVAGIAYHLDRLVNFEDEDQLEEALIWGTAAAVSNAMHKSAGSIQMDQVHEYQNLVRSIRL